MEDGVTEVERLLSPLNLSSEDGSKGGEGNEEKEEGFVSKEKAEKVKQEDHLGREHTGQDSVAKDEAKDNCGGGGGLINNLISTLMSPRTGKATEQHESGNRVFESDGGGDDHGKRGGGVDNGGEGGLISNLVSNFFHRRECEEGVVETDEKDKEEEESIADEKIKRLKTQNIKANNGGGGGIIHDIVSHLPASLPDDAVPTADEATILINSLVRD